MSFYTLEPSYQPRRGYPAFSTGRDFFEPDHSYSPFSQPDESYYSAIAEEHERRAAIARQKAEEATVARLLAQQHREEQLRRQEYLHHLNTPSPFAVDLSQVFRRPSQRPSALETALSHSRFANRNPRPQRQRAIRLAPSSAPKSINDIFGVELNREEPYYLAELEAHKARKEKEKALKARQAEQESLNAALSAQFEELVLAALNLATPSPAEEPQMAPKAESSSSKGKGRAEPVKPFNFANSNKSTESSKVTSDAPKNVDSSERERLELADAIVATNSALIELEQEFQKAKDSFAFPAHLDFSPPTPSSDSSPIDSVPSLLYTPANIELHFYENRLTTLLTKLDTVESHGIALIREARKGLAAKIEKELQLLDEKKLEEWKAQSSASRPVSPALIAVKSGEALAEEEDVDVSVSAADIKTEETEEVKVTPSASDSDKHSTSTTDDQSPASLLLEDSTATITPHKDVNEDNASSIATLYAPVDGPTSEDLVSTPVESEPSQQLDIAFQPATIDAKDLEAPVFAPSEDATQEPTINHDSSGASNSPSELEFESSSTSTSPRDDFALLHDSIPSDKDESDSDTDIDGRTLTITPPYFNDLDDSKPELAKKEPAEVSREIGEDKLSDFEML